jgi:hypothetical protein
VYLNEMGCEVDSYGTGYGAVVVLCEYCKEASRSIIDGEFLDWLGAL